MRQYLSLLLLLLAAWTTPSVADPVSASQAEQVARAFMARQRHKAAPLRMSRLKTAQTAADPTAVEPYYVFNTEASQGFVIVSGDDRFASVIGYADHGRFALADAPASLRAWMELYASYVRAYWANDSLAAAPATQDQASVVVAPLLGEIAWGQDAPFNDQCPTYTASGTTTHYYTGCVAAAATQIMRYHKYPAQGTGTKKCVVNGIALSADFGATLYDWDNMLPYYPRTGSFTDKQRTAVSTLAAQFGVAVEMEYAKDGSGASPMMVPGALRQYFGYDRHVTLRKRNYYSTTEWMQIIKEELQAGRPVYYGGASDAGQGGHAFVCDGYDSNDYVHINWGWYGTSNGYFLINRLNPGDLGEGGGTGGYNRDQEMVTGIQPPTQSDDDVCLPLYGSVRLSITPYGGNRFSLMTILENLDTDEFDGEIAAVVTQQGRVVKVLKTEALQVKGYAGGLSGTAYLTMRDITATADGLADGAYEIRFAYRATGAKTWQVVRHYTGYPRYADMTVADGQVILGEIHAIKPRVELLKPISSEADIHAGGSAVFRLSLRNHSDDVQLKSVVVQLTSQADPTITVRDTTATMVYEESSADVSVLMDIPDDLAAGTYEVTAYEKGYADCLFDDSQVGRATVQVLPLTQRPLLGITQAVEWSTNSGATTLKQGDMLMLGLVVRNYGAAGKAGVITRLQRTDDASQSYVFRQVDASLAKGEQKTITTGRYLNVDAGTYLVTVSAVGTDGQQIDVRQPDVQTTLVIEPRADLAVRVKSLTLPTLLSPGKSVAGQLVVHLEKDYSNYIYLRLRGFTNSGGELVLMKRISNGKAGDDMTFDFKYTPSLALGTYMPLVEYKEGSSYVGADGLSNYYHEFSVVDATGVGSVSTAQGIEVWPRRVSDMVHVQMADGSAVERVTVTSVSGAIAWTGRPDQGQIDLSALPQGLYLLSASGHGTTATVKIVRQ